MTIKVMAYQSIQRVSKIQSYCRSNILNNDFLSVRVRSRKGLVGLHVVL